MVVATTVVICARAADAASSTPKDKAASRLLIRFILSLCPAEIRVHALRRSRWLHSPPSCPAHDKPAFPGAVGDRAFMHGLAVKVFISDVSSALIRPAAL